MSSPNFATPPQIQGGEGSNSSDRFVWEKFPQLPSIGDPGADDRPVPRGHLDSLDVTHFEGADGSAGQVLETDGTNVAWVDKDASEFSGSAGSQGQVLETDGTNVAWVDKDASEFSGSAGSQGQVLTTDGSSASWQSVSSPLNVDTEYFNPTMSVGDQIVIDLTLKHTDGYEHGMANLNASSDARSDDEYASLVSINRDGSGNIVSINVQNNDSDKSNDFDIWWFGVVA